jgi:hypothetical protein
MNYNTKCSIIRLNNTQMIRFEVIDNIPNNFIIIYVKGWYYRYTVFSVGKVPFKNEFIPIPRSSYMKETCSRYFYIFLQSN